MSTTDPAPEEGATPAKPPAKRTPSKRTPRKAATAKTEPATPPAAEPAQEAPEAENTPHPSAPELVDTFTAWARVMRDVGPIGKGERNADLGFKFRGIDATMNTTGPALRTHGVAVLPVGVEVLESERYESKRGVQMHGMVTRHDWLIIGPFGPLTYPDGSPIVMQTLGQASDTSDKVASKASSVAYRTALLQSLTVPTGDKDPDAESHERAAARPADPRDALWARIKELGAKAGANTDAMAKHYRDHMGHVIDGPEATPEKLQEYIDRLESHYAAQQAAADAEGSQDPAATVAPAEPEPTLPADAPAATQEEPPPAASEPPADEPADPGTPAPPAAQTASQGPDPRQRLWDDILAHAKRLRWSLDTCRDDFRQWTEKDTGRPLEIDGPLTETTHDLLTRYAHVLRRKADEAQA